MMNAAGEWVGNGEWFAVAFVVVVLVVVACSKG